VESGCAMELLQAMLCAVGGCLKSSCWGGGVAGTCYRHGAGCRGRAVVGGVRAGCERWCVRVLAG